MKIIFVCDAAGVLTAYNTTTGLGAGLEPNEFVEMRQGDSIITNPCANGLTKDDTYDLAVYAGNVGLTTYLSNKRE